MTKDLSRRTTCAAAMLTAGLAFVAGPASADAATKKARLAASSLAGLPATVTTGTKLVATGKVKNTGKGSSAAQLSFKLRTDDAPYVSLGLGGGRTASIKPGRSGSFKVPLTVGRTPNAAQDGKGYVLVVCVSRSRKDTVRRCRKSPKSAILNPDQSVSSGSAAPAAPAAPAPAAPAPAAPAPVTVTTTTPAPTPPPVPVDPTVYESGARSLGDTLFPTIGNGGYDVQHYDLDLSYDISNKYLTGSSTAKMNITQDLKDFSFDLASYVVAKGVEVDGVPATFEQDVAKQKLIITPKTPIKAGAVVSTKVRYEAIEQAFIDPDGSKEGWVPDTVRGAIVVSEPIGAMGWFPNNNVPFDKATYTLKMAVPELAEGVAPWNVLATGVEVGAPVVADGKRTYTWDNPDQTASYLMSVAIGKFDVATTMTTPTTANPLSTPFTTAVDSSFTTGKPNQVTNLNRTPAIVDFFAEYYSMPYAFNAKGGIVPRIPVGYSLETQGKPVYAGSTSATYGGAGISTIAHENAHMYFGDYLTLTQWKDIWLNEGMTEFTTRLWTERQNNPTSNPASTLNGYFTTQYNTTSTTFWNIAPAAPPTASDIFNNNAMYTRGSMVMIGIKDILGETAFKELMNSYLTRPDHQYGNTTSEEFIAMVKAKDLTDRTAAGTSDRTARWTEFFKQWLYTGYTGAPAAGNKPQMTAANFDTYVLPAAP